VWEAGRCISGSWTDRNGLAYTGRYENGLPSSDGEYLLPSGLKLKGYYTQAKEKGGAIALRWVQQAVIGPTAA